MENPQASLPRLEEASETVRYSAEGLLLGLIDSPGPPERAPVLSLTQPVTLRCVWANDGSRSILGPKYQGEAGITVRPS